MIGRVLFPKVLGLLVIDCNSSPRRDAEILPGDIPIQSDPLAGLELGDLVIGQAFDIDCLLIECHDSDP